MQREIKLRVWNKAWACMYYLTGFHLVGKTHIQLYYLDSDGDNTTCTVLIKNIIIMQFTGLLDKNGKDIYEGDILDIRYCFAEKGIVKFGKYKQCDMSSDYECGNQGFYVDSTKGTDRYRHDLYYYAPISEDIGNIHDNSELLNDMIG